VSEPLPVSARGGERRQRLRVQPRQGRQVGRVPAKPERQQPRVLGPPRGQLRPGREHVPVRPAGQPGHEHRGPLQALGRVHGRQLDRVGVADPPALEAELLRLGGGEIGQERAQRRLVLVAGEGRRRVGERVEVGVRARRVSAEL